VIQGANDPRVNKAEAEQIVVALRDRNFPVEYMLAPDEGHGFHRTVNNMAMFMAIEKFLAKHLDGRYQDGATPEVQKGLTEIMVDPATVKAPPKADASAATIPKTATGLSPGTYRYQAKISVGGQEIAIKMSTTITEDGSTYVDTDTMETPMGLVTDKATLDKATLEVKKRVIEQGPVAIDVHYAEGKASGKMAMNGQERPIDAPTGGPLFADAAGAQQAIGALPLASGYKATYRNFDLQKQKQKLMQLEVTGGESVTVPAGTFDCYKVEQTLADGSAEKATIWIDKATRKAVKMSSAMNGATMVSELLP